MKWIRAAARTLCLLCFMLGGLIAAMYVIEPALLPWNGVVAADEFDAAQKIRDNLAQNKNRTLLKMDKLDHKALYQVLEATWPYAFSLYGEKHYAQRYSVTIDTENKASQEQAYILAQGIAQNSFADPHILLRDKIRVLHDYVVSHCEYDVDTARQESFAEGSGAYAPFTAAGALVDGKAVCSGYARAFMMLCDAAQIDAVYIADEQMNHGWNAVRIYDTIYYVDTTYDDPVPDRGELVSTKYFLLEREEFAQSHQWDTSFYDRLLSYALPPALGDAQRLYDLGLLPVPPRAEMLSQPISNAVRTRLAQTTGLSFNQDCTLAQAASQAWQALQSPVLQENLIAQGLLDRVRAKLTGLLSADTENSNEA